ncbi:MAG: inositol monophosphatase [Caldilineaceae bacterium SB0668_bin_21]|nr:inositol monophosphatase [Caldilineaceae bacterium SB0668_bin_21]MYC23576.1 inositol monophosphatase [Caldilineaceae bacterium SB0662_bin_25]
MTSVTETERTPSQEEELPVAKTPLFELARQAGELALTMQQGGLRSIHAKSTPNDLVTEADLACETLIRDRLAALTSNFGFWGEESDERPQDDYYWLVDPIDGTINFAAGLPWFGINIALIHRNMTIFGLSLILPQFELFWAQVGQGTYLRRRSGEQQRLQVSRASTLADALLTTGFPYHRAVNEDNNAAEFARIMPVCRGVRRMGASSADLAYVASGAFSAYWEGWIKPWDVAAGVLLVREAGGLVTNYQGAPFGLDDHCIIASNGQPGVHETLLCAIQEARSEKFDQDRRKG